ncbi:hypothetical protein WA026_013585 [Henosepilachna vigintioctopunctata]|uniref:Uncharacterized protein n=1 Tax=Henosepilachna vigintioctopunctata TaxID=420089 RepID=A0AAW1V7J7_9CUCU
MLHQPIPDEDLNLESVGFPTDVVTSRTLKRAIPANTDKKRKGGPDSTDQLVGLATEYFKRPETEEDILAKGWAMKLKKLAPNQRRFAEKIINDALFEAEMGTLIREGVRCGMYPNWSPSPPLSSYSSVNSWPRYPQSGPSKHSPVKSPSYKGQHHEMSLIQLLRFSPHLLHCEFVLYF